MTDSNEPRHAHTPDLDGEVGKYGTVRSDYEGVMIVCPNCREETSVWHAIKHGHCIQCKMSIDIYIGYGDPEPGEAER